MTVPLIMVRKQVTHLSQCWRLINPYREIPVTHFVFLRPASLYRQLINKEFVNRDIFTLMDRTMSMVTCNDIGKRLLKTTIYLKTFKIISTASRYEEAGKKWRRRK